MTAAAYQRLADKADVMAHSMSAAVLEIERAKQAGSAPAFDRDAAVKRARELLAPALREREAPTYPVAALGPLADACEAIATHGQVSGEGCACIGGDTRSQAPWRRCRPRGRTSTLALPMYDGSPGRVGA